MKNKFLKGLNFVKNKITSVTQQAYDKTINLTSNILEETQSGEYIKDIYIALRNRQLYLGKEEYIKNYCPLNKYYTPEPQTSNPILYIAVISFNQKKGAIVEFTYPDIDTLKNNKESNEYLQLLCDKNNKDISSIEKVVENINYQLTYLCMPDGAHILKNDSQFFLIQNLPKLLYGISCYRQLQTTSKEDEQENTRDCVQKAMCIISKVPLFGQMASKLSATMLAYFYQESLKDKKIIEDLYSNYKISSKSSVNINEIFASFSLKKLLSLTNDKIFSIIKLIMLEKKILVYSHISNNVCSFIFSLLSLFPCNAFFNLDYNSPESKIYYQCYKQYGLPLKFINKNSVLFSLMTLYDISNIENKEVKSYLIGTTNPIFINYKKLEFDCIVNIDENKITFNKNLSSALLRSSRKERAFMKEIIKQCHINNTQLNNDNIISGDLVYEESDLKNNKDKKDNKSSPKKNSLYNRQNKEKENKDDELLEKQTIIEDFKDSDDCIRNMFKKFITEFLADIALVKYLVFSNDDTESENSQANDNLSIHGSEKKLQDIKQVLTGYNYFFILNWITTTKNFKFWNYEHYSELWSFSSHLTSTNNVSKFYENGDHYIGDMKHGIPDGKGTLSTSLDGIGYTYMGKFKDGKKNGKGSLSSNDNKYNYDGWWKNDKKEGLGTLFNNGDKYTGDFVDDKYCGNGTLCSKNGDIYEVEFKDNKPNGVGRVIKVNGDSYVGTFLDGKIFGQISIKYKNGDSYDGSYQDDKKSGYGCQILHTGETYEGNFENNLYNGEGKLTTSDGEVIFGIFKNGVCEKRLEEKKIVESKEEKKIEDEEKKAEGEEKKVEDKDKKVEDEDKKEEQKEEKETDKKENSEG